MRPDSAPSWTCEIWLLLRMRTLRPGADWNAEAEMDFRSLSDKSRLPRAENLNKLITSLIFQLILMLDLMV